MKRDGREVPRRAAMLCAAVREDNGNALVELACIVAFFLLPLMVGTAEIGILVYDWIEISDAACAGVSYGEQSVAAASDTSGIQSAAQQDAPDVGATLTVTPTTYYVCSAAMTGVHYTGANAQANATAACTGTSNRAVEMIQVNTSATITPPLHLPTLPRTFTLVAQSIAEVQS